MAIIIELVGLALLCHPIYILQFMQQYHCVNSLREHWARHAVCIHVAGFCSYFWVSVSWRKRNRWTTFSLWILRIFFFKKKLLDSSQTCICNGYPLCVCVYKSKILHPPHTTLASWLNA